MWRKPSFSRAIERMGWSYAVQYITERVATNIATRAFIYSGGRMQVIQDVDRHVDAVFEGVIKAVVDIGVKVVRAIAEFFADLSFIFTNFAAAVKAS